MENQPSDQIQCPNCKELIHKDARVCKHCGKKFTSKTVKIGLAIIFGFIVLSIVISSSSNTSSTPVAAPTGHSDVEVCTEAEHLLEQFLKAPSTAKYPTCLDTTIEKLSEDKFKVTSYVDSQNSFGAMIRSTWSITYHYTDNGTRTQLDLVVIDGKTVFGGK